MADSGVKIEIPTNVGKIISILNNAGYEAYAVGGCVRDSLLGREPSDWDITTSAGPQKVKDIFNKTVDTGIQHGTVTVLLGGRGYEVTTYRIDGRYTDSRHPETVEFTSDLREDLLRRDFTINAMAYHPGDGLVDPFSGRADLGRRLIRCVGEPKARFGEDALRMMRAFRFAAQLDFVIDDETLQAVSDLHDSISKISAERIRDEFVKLACSDHPEMLRLLYENGLTGVFMPEFDEMFVTEQNTRHHCYDVGEHTLHAMTALAEMGKDEASSRKLRLAALFHDIGKPQTRKTDSKGIDHFVGHPQVGEKITRRIMRRLKFDNDSIDAVSRLVRFHDERPLPSKRNMRRLMSRAGEDMMPRLFALKRADIAAQSDYMRSEKLAQVDELENYYSQIVSGRECVSLKDLAIGGRELMENGFERGPVLGEVLSYLLKLVIDDPTMNTGSVLLDEAERYRQNN